MRFLGIIPAKSISKRFPGKNQLLYRNVLKEMGKSVIDHTIVTTDDVIINNSCAASQIHKRYMAEVDLDLPLIDVIKNTYLSTSGTYDYIICAFANTQNLKATDVNKMIMMAEANPELQEIRSFNKNGIENGLILLSVKRVLEGQISSYIGAITTDAKEIHTKEDLD